MLFANTSNARHLLIDLLPDVAMFKDRNVFVADLHSHSYYAIK